ncbi:MAG: hypothetical protein ABR887_01770 [Methanoregulaceae archaeon]
MVDIEHPKCPHPKCGAKMQRIYTRTKNRYHPCGWLCECGTVKIDSHHLENDD